MTLQSQLRERAIILAFIADMLDRGSFESCEVARHEQMSTVVCGIRANIWIGVKGTRGLLLSTWQQIAKAVLDGAAPASTINVLLAHYGVLLPAEHI